MYVIDADAASEEDSVKFRGLTTGALLTMRLSKARLEYSTGPSYNFTAFGTGDWGNLSFSLSQVEKAEGSYTSTSIATAKFTQVNNAHFF